MADYNNNERRSVTRRRSTSSAGIRAQAGQRQQARVKPTRRKGVSASRRASSKAAAEASRATGQETQLQEQPQSMLQPQEQPQLQEQPHVAAKQRRTTGAMRQAARDRHQAAAVQEQISDSVDGAVPVADGDDVELTSKRVGDIRQEERAKRLRASSRRYFLRIFIVIGIVVALLAGWAALYNSTVFSIENVTVNGVEHLTNDEMTQLANVPAETTLLRVDVDSIAERLRQNSWVQDVQINRVFPDTLEINVTERPVAAVVEIPISQGSAVKEWAIAPDHTWLMPIPEVGSEAAQTTSPKIYEDAENALRIVGVPYGTEAQIGQVCTDENVNNALDIIGGMTTDLAGQVKLISASSVAETTLELDSGVEIAFGKAEDIRDKERVIQQIIDDNPYGVAYINVRMVQTPTWRSI